MQVLKTINELEQFQKEKKSSLGFVPTMGALHPGHLSLIDRSTAENDCTICSVFVNPIQFNNVEDLKKYPRDITRDIELLSSTNCDAVFIPDEKEMYPGQPQENFDFGLLEDVMEGKFRPGHFKGVAIVVKRFFDLIQPTKAYFGMKDFQQLAVIKSLVKQTQTKVEIVGCPTIREENGLAMSSRNRLLSEEEHGRASLIHEWLSEIQSAYAKEDLAEVKQRVLDRIMTSSGFQLEYLEVVDPDTFKTIREWGAPNSHVCCIAVFLGNTRLIDNLLF